MSKIKTYFVIALSALSTIQSFSQTIELDLLEKKFNWMDTVIFLMEDIPELSLNDKHENIRLHIKKYPKDSSKIGWLLKSITNKQNTLSKIALDKLKPFQVDVTNSQVQTHFKSMFSELYHHTKRLFENIVYDGKVFDETPHIQYYQHRLRLNQAINQARQDDIEKKAFEGLERKQNELLICIQDLMDQVDSLKNEVNGKLDTVKMFFLAQQRDNLVNKLIRNRKLRFDSGKISNEKFELLTRNKSFKQARKAVKQASKH